MQEFFNPPVHIWQFKHCCCVLCFVSQHDDAA